MITDAIISVVFVFVVAVAMYVNVDAIDAWQNEVKDKPLSWRDNRD